MSNTGATIYNQFLHCSNCWNWATVNVIGSTCVVAAITSQNACSEKKVFESDRCGNDKDTNRQVDLLAWRLTCQPWTTTPLVCVLLGTFAACHSSLSPCLWSSLYCLSNKGTKRPKNTQNTQTCVKGFFICSSESNEKHAWKGKCSSGSWFFFLYSS